MDKISLSRFYKEEQHQCVIARNFPIFCRNRRSIKTLNDIIGEQLTCRGFHTADGKKICQNLCDMKSRTKLVRMLYEKH
jgi:hypothetical protein